MHGRTPSVARPEAPEPLRVPVVDNHCHLEMGLDDDGATPVEQALTAAAAVGVPRIVQIGCDLPSARWTVETVERHDALVGGVAIHPNEAPRLAARGALEAAYAEIDRLAAHPRIRVVGETGLDHFRTPREQWDIQEEAFRRHIAMAKAHGKALQIHDRDAHDDVLTVLEDEGAPERTVFHCFSGDAAMARYCADRGYVLSFAGTVTFKNAQPLRDALAATSLDHVLVETDAPFLTPAPYRGRPNAPYLLPFTVRAMAAVKGVDEEAMAAATAATAEQVYGPW
jgi:TatD DNase family protein